MNTDEEATRAALQRYAAQGSDLTKPMKIDFFVAVPSAAAGNAVAVRAVALGFETSIEQDGKTSEWTCYCTKTIIPAFDTVIRIERELDAIGRSFGGYADGFGSYGNAN